MQVEDDTGKLWSNLLLNNLTSL